MTAPRRNASPWLAALATIAATLLAACGSTPTVRWHTLLPAALPAAATAPAAPAYVLAPFRLPAQVDAPQWLVRRADDTVTVLEQDRWASPLRDELRLALVAGLAAAGAREAVGGPAADEPAATRITIEWRRFESLLGREAREEGTYTLQRREGVALRCDFLLREPASGGIDALAEGHRRIVAALALRLDRSLRGNACPAD